MGRNVYYTTEVKLDLLVIEESYSSPPNYPMMIRRFCRKLVKKCIIKLISFEKWVDSFRGGKNES